MAGSIPDMLINVRLETAALKSDMANLENKFKGLGSAVSAQQNPMKNFGKSLLVAAGVGLSVAGLTHFTKEVISAGEESQRSDARLNQIAKSMGIFGDASTVVTKRLIDLADSQARLTGVDDDVIKQSQAKLLTFRELALSAGTMGGAFDRATKATIDMAAAGFGDATSNAVQLGKALQDPIKGVTALARSGITFTDQEKQKIKTLVESNKMMDAQAFVLKAIEKQVGGTAAATATSSDKMKVAFGQVEEAIGIALLPIVEKFSKWIQDVGPKVELFFKQLNDPTTKTGAAWKSFTDVIFNAFSWINKNAGALTVWAAAIGGVMLTVNLLKAAWVGYTTVVNIAKIAQAWLDIALGAMNPAALAIGVAVLAGGILAIGAAAATANGQVQGLNSSLDVTDTYAGGNGGYLGPGIKNPFNTKGTKTNPWTSDNPGPGFTKIIPGSPQSYGNNPQPGTVATWVDSKTSKWVTSTWTGTSWTSAKAVTYTGDTPGGGGKVDPAAKKAETALVASLKSTQKQLLDARKTYDDAVKAANDKYGSLIKQYSDEMTSVIQESMNRLKSAWASAVSTDIGQMFSDLSKDGSVSADRLLVNLKSKLESIKNLAKNAAALSGLGFSQTFIEQVIAQGPDVGNAMASALQNTSAANQKELQSLFADSEYVTNNGMNTLASTMYAKAGLATDALKAQFDTAKKNMETAQADLAKALSDAAGALDKSLKTISDAFTTYLKNTKADLKAHLAEINAIKKDIASNQNIASTPTVTPAKGRLDMTAEEYAASMAAFEKDYVAGGGTLTQPTDGVIKFGRAAGVTNNVSVSVDTNASPALIADTVVAALKFGTPWSSAVGMAAV